MNHVDMLGKCFAALTPKEFERLKKYVDVGKHVLCGIDCYSFAKDGCG